MDFPFAQAKSWAFLRYVFHAFLQLAQTHSSLAPSCCPAAIHDNPSAQTQIFIDVFDSYWQQAACKLPQP